MVKPCTLVQGSWADLGEHHILLLDHQGCSSKLHWKSYSSWFERFCSRAMILCFCCCFLFYAPTKKISKPNWKMSPEFNIKGEKTKQTTHVFNFIISSKQNLAVLLNNLNYLPRWLEFKEHQCYSPTIRGNISIKQESENLSPLLPHF